MFQALILKENQTPHAKQLNNHLLHYENKFRENWRCTEHTTTYAQKRENTRLYKEAETKKNKARTNHPRSEG